MPARKRHTRAIAVTLGCASLALALSTPARATAHPRHPGPGVERAVLPAGDGGPPPRAPPRGARTPPTTTSTR
ncbi:hypothetical protein SMICM17S_03620 [Streptomyces microflavus]